MGRLTEFLSNNSGAPIADITVNPAVEMDMQKALARMMVSDKQLSREIRNLISKELRKAAKNIRADIKNAFYDDPRKAYLAVKSSVYKRMLGGNVSILNPRRAGARYLLLRKRKIDENPHQWGGNRRKRSNTTIKEDSYFGKDRAYILRFNNSGTVNRITRYGSRGAITGRNMFGISAAFQMQEAEHNIAKIIEEEVNLAFKG